MNKKISEMPAIGAGDAAPLHTLPIAIFFERLARELAIAMQKSDEPRLYLARADFITHGPGASEVFAATIRAYGAAEAIELAKLRCSAIAEELSREKDWPVTFRLTHVEPARLECEETLTKNLPKITATPPAI